MSYPPARPRTGAGAMITSAVIGVLALAATLITIVANDDDGPNLSGGPGPGQYSGQAGGGVAVNGGAGASSGSGGSGGNAPSTRSVLTQRYVEQHFPLPPGGRRDPYERPPLHQYWYVTNTPIETVRQFYLAAFRRIGVTCDLQAPDDPLYHGYTCNFVDAKNPNGPSLGHMQLRNRITDYPPRLVLAQGYFDE